jgi:hypothetical protein
MLSFLFSGLFLFRFAERRFLGSLLKEPPRSTRLQSFYPPIGIMKHLNVFANPRSGGRWHPPI